MSGRGREAKLDAATIAIADGVLVFTYASGVYVDEDIARSVIAAATELAGPLAPLPTLVRLEQVKGTSKAARDFFATSPENGALSSRVAMVIGSPIARIVANFFVGLNKTAHPTKLFTDESRAWRWLRDEAADAEP